jgi:hypothetical protein
LAIYTPSQLAGRLGDVGRGDTFEIADSARMPIAFDALCACQQNVQF